MSPSAGVLADRKLQTWWEDDLENVSTDAFDEPSIHSFQPTVKKPESPSRSKLVAPCGVTQLSKQLPGLSDVIPGLDKCRLGGICWISQDHHCPEFIVPSKPRGLS